MEVDMEVDTETDVQIEASTSMQASNSTQNQPTLNLSPRPALRGPIPLSLSLDEGEEVFTIPDPDELSKDLGLSPGHKHLLRHIRENIEPISRPPTDSPNSQQRPTSQPTATSQPTPISYLPNTTHPRTTTNSALTSNLAGPSQMICDDEDVGNEASNVNEAGSNEAQSGTTAPVSQLADTHILPAGFSPNAVKGFLKKVARAIEIGPGQAKRRYQFHVRVAKPKSSPPMRRKIRLQRALRGDNPFLRWRTERHCCDRYRCFSTLCPNYLFEEYKKINAMNKLQAKRYLISLFNPTDRLWYVRGDTVCSRFLQQAFGYSTDIQCQVKGTPGARSAPTARALPRQVRRKTKRWYISNFILRIAQRFAEAMPHKEEFSLPLFTKTMLWKEFETFWNERMDTERHPLPSKCYFFSIWKQDAKIVKVQKKRHGFAVCNRCEMLRKEMAKHLQDEETLNVLLEQYAAHLRFVERERDAYEARQSMAEENPNKYCSIIIDGADQKNFGLPHLPLHTKSDCGHKLKVKIFGCLEHVLRGGERLSLYAMTEEYATGANHVIEVAHRVLQQKKHETGKLPPNVFVQVDNCRRENKNRYFFAYFQLLVHLGVFRTVQISFLPIGHTHADIDHSFSSISAHLDIKEGLTFEDMICELSKCYAGRATAFELDWIANFSDLCEASGCLTGADQFAEYRFFRFTRKENSDNHGLLSSTCDVKVQEYDSWEPFPSNRAEGFLKFVPNLRNTPNTKTKELTNFAEISKGLESAEERVKDTLKMKAPVSLRDKVFEVREEQFHWNVDSIFEMHGDYLSEPVDTAHLPSSHVQEQIRPNCGYDPDEFVAVETKEDENTRFWIARVKQVSELDSQGRAKMLRIRWYVPRGNDPWNAKYVPAWKVSDGETTVYEDTIDIACILVRFTSFTTAGKLRVSDKKAIKQMLDAN